MKDYYAEYLNKKNRNVLETLVPKVSKGVIQPLKEAFDTKHPDEYSKKFLENLFANSPDLRDQFEFEIQERIAFMTIDGGLPETEAEKAATETTTDIWLKIFTESI